MSTILRQVIRTLAGVVHGLDVKGNPVWNRKDGSQIVLDADDTTGSPFVQTTTKTGTQANFTIGGVVVTLSTDRTLAAADDQTVFSVTSAVVVTVPNLTSMPTCTFVCTGSGSVTIRPAGAVTVNGAQLDVVKSSVTDPAGFTLVPIYGSANTYATTSSVNTFGTISGAYSDNASLVARFAAIATDINPGAAALSGNVTITANNSTSYIGATLYMKTAVSGDRSVTISSGLPSNFRLRLANDSTGFALTVAAATTNVTIHSKGGALRLVGQYYQAQLWARADTADTYYLTSSEGLST